MGYRKYNPWPFIKGNLGYHGSPFIKGHDGATGEQFFSKNPFLEMIGKDDKINYLYVKSKPSFETSLLILRKLVELIKIHLQYNFGSSMLKRKVITAIFLKLPC